MMGDREKGLGASPSATALSPSGSSQQAVSPAAPLQSTGAGRDLPRVWGADVGVEQSLGPDLRAVTWPVQGRSGAPDNLFDWLLADNRYPQHRGRRAALALIEAQAREIDRLRSSLSSDLIFEPHSGFGGDDPDGVPWPFGYISESVGRPIFELGVPLEWPGEKLLATLESLGLASAAGARSGETPQEVRSEGRQSGDAKQRDAQTEPSK